VSCCTLLHETFAHLEASIIGARLRLHADNRNSCPSDFGARADKFCGHLRLVGAVAVEARQLVHINILGIDQSDYIYMYLVRMYVCIYLNN
jgi:hypothetical protein